MARPLRKRCIGSPPLMQGFRPFGISVCVDEPQVLTYDEYESLKLVNYENLPQEDAALRMQVSRPTFTRIYNRALKTLTKALVEGNVVLIEGGSCRFDSDWYRCRKCHRLISGIENHNPCAGCKEFDNNELIPINRNHAKTQSNGARCSGSSHRQGDGSV